MTSHQPGADIGLRTVELPPTSGSHHAQNSLRDRGNRHRRRLARGVRKLEIVELTRRGQHHDRSRGVAQGDIPDSAVYVVQTDPAGKYTVKVPEGWARTTSSSGVSFTDKLNTIRVETAPATAAPTVASATATEVPKSADLAERSESSGSSAA